MTKSNENKSNRKTGIKLKASLYLQYCNVLGWYRMFIQFSGMRSQYHRYMQLVYVTDN